MRALLKDMDDWVTKGLAPPDDRMLHIADGTLVPDAKAGWPKIPGVRLPAPYKKTYRLDFGPEWSKGIALNEPPKVGQMYEELVPALDANGNGRGGIRLPAIEVPIGTYGGWNFRSTRDRAARPAVRRDGFVPSLPPHQGGADRER